MHSALLILAAIQASDPRPTMDDFMGVNGHTVQFRAALYAPALRRVRDYHPFEWDMGKETDFVPRFPEARNRVNWNDVYGSWKKEGFETDLCVMLNGIPPDSWKDVPRDARAYGQALARAFGPSSEKKLVSSIEVGNEPGNYPDEKYRAVFQAMAQGLREGDPKVRILTCNMIVGKSGGYEKSVDCVKGLEALYDVLNIHTYAMAEGWPTWKRSYPEDPKLKFLTTVQDLIDWRNANAKGKEIWVTEFGWDASTKPNKTTGDFAKWDGNVSDEKQAQYLVRAWLLFSAMDVRRAYMYFFNDEDEPSFHAASGLTRNFQPKPSFHATAHLHRVLAEYRFSRVIEKKAGELYAFEYVHAANPKKKVLVAWSPTGSGRTAEVELPVAGASRVRAERMALAPGEPPTVEATPTKGGLKVTVGESPMFLFLGE
jgi:hypothetical protein